MASTVIQIKESADEWQLALPPLLDFAAARQLLKQIRDFAPAQAPVRLCLDFSQTTQSIPPASAAFNSARRAAA